MGRRSKFFNPKTDWSCEANSGEYNKEHEDYYTRWIPSGPRQLESPMRIGPQRQLESPKEVEPQDNRRKARHKKSKKKKQVQRQRQNNRTIIDTLIACYGEELVIDAFSYEVGAAQDAIDIMFDGFDEVVEGMQLSNDEMYELRTTIELLSEFIGEFHKTRNRGLTRRFFSRLFGRR